MSKPKGKRAPKSTFTQEVADKIVAKLRAGIPLTVICSESGMPCDDTVRNWADARPELARDIARAREAGFDVIAQRARLTLRGKGEAEGGESTGDVQRDKAVADFDLKLLAKWDPKRYGERQTVDLNAEVVTMTAEQRAARIAELLAKANGSDRS